LHISSTHTKEKNTKFFIQNFCIFWLGTFGVPEYIGVIRIWWEGTAFSYISKNKKKKKKFIYILRLNCFPTTITL
jgi:hypothetical protein